MRILSEVLELVFPKICPSCDWHRPARQNLYCVECSLEMPETGFHLIPDNAFEMHFWGRVKIESGSAMYYFIPDGRTQVLLHNIKYRRAKYIAVELGRMYARQLLESPRLSDLTHIIPVPLHWRKQRLRGFNQSEEFARGISHGMGVPCRTDILHRNRNTPSQTRKSREQRIANMTGAFHATPMEGCTNSHFLLLDDVMTTGATLEACALTLLELPGAKVSIATIACGRI